MDEGHPYVNITLFHTGKSVFAWFIYFMNAMHVN